MPTIKAILLVLAISAFASSANGRTLLQAEEYPKGDMETTFYHHGTYFPPYGWPYGGRFGRTGGRFGSIGPGFGGSMGSAIGSGVGGSGMGGEIGSGGIGSENNGGGGGGDNGSVIGVEKGAFEVPGDGVEGGMH